MPARRFLRLDMKKIFAISLIGLLTGCDSRIEKISDFFTGTKTNTVVIANQPLLIDKTPQTFSPASKAEVLGDWSSVCFALVGDKPLKDANEMDRILETAVSGSKLKAVITLGDKDRVILDSQGSSWNMIGTILKRDELSVCLSAMCKTNLQVGAAVTRIEVSADPPISVQGIYWNSSTPPGGAMKQSTVADPSTQKASAGCTKS